MHPSLPVANCCSSNTDHAPFRLRFVLVHAAAYHSPAFRDGVISLAVDDAVDMHNILYFTAVGNDGLGLRFTSVSACIAQTESFLVNY